MLPARYTSGDREIICPYDKTHVIVAKSLNAHLLKCRKNHLDMPMVVCRFDKTHHIPKPEKAYHESGCPSQYLMDRERLQLAGEPKQMGDVIGPPIVADHNTAIDNEDWGACAPVRTPALFNKMEPSEDFVGPYMPSDLSQRQTNLPKTSHVLPQTSSMAAGMASMASKKKALPSSVFEFTSTYGRGRGKIMAPNKPAAKLPVHQTNPAPVLGQFEDTTASEPVQRQLSPPSSLPSTVNTEKETEQYLQQLNLQFTEQQKKLSQEQQLLLLRLEKNFAEQRQQLLMRQEQMLKQALTASSSCPSAPPPGFDPAESSASTVKDMGVLNKTTVIALQKEKSISSKEEESWHEETQGASGPACGRNLINSIGLNETQNVNHVTNWLSNQHIDDIDDPGALAVGAESPSESQKQKRKWEKKLRQINVLEQKVSLGHKLSKPEEHKLNQKPDVIAQLATLDCVMP